MSLSPSLRDELLSAYLDGEVSPDERARIEQMLASDALLVQRFEQLKRLRRELSRLATATPVSSLPADFSARVLQSVFAAAEAESLTVEHPVRIAHQQFNRQALHRQRWYRSRGFVRVMVAIAASGLIMFALRSGVLNDSNTPSANQLASSLDGNPSEKSSVQPIDQALVVPDIQEASVFPVGAPGTELARVEKELQFSLEPNFVQPIDSLNSSEPSSTPMSPNQAELVNRDPSAIEPIPISSIPLFAMLLEVKLRTPPGDITPISDALAVAGIPPLRHQNIPHDVLAGLASTRMITGDAPGSADSGQDVQLLVLEAPAKQVDRFFLELVCNHPDVESVGMNLVMDPPTIKVVRDLSRVRPTDVQHTPQNGIAQRLVGNETSQVWFRRATGGPAFRTLPKESKPMAMGSLHDSGPDIVSTLVLLVRN